ncbi:M23 family metallopeptidase [Paenibacillus sp. FSL H7-0331]|uniref:M23 family metallopeptidase n=1 Tax=Paenibacillus sp. FSL H7-0331 TaxID=1920421 RepID=UPI00096EC837|nr:M23 family metallopeptidase [Paenibacillus sp. FSL H7-0331]OMF15690.1 hypothetical protein BK127_15270 [Paenibacillus sp. FSL H7-0331]
METRDKMSHRQMEQLRESAERWNDPEYVWKRKWMQEYSEQAKEDPEDGGGWPFRPNANSIRIKLVISCALFAAVWGLFQINHPWANIAKSHIEASLNESFDFHMVTLWYERQWGGNPSLLPAWMPGKQQEAQKVTALKKQYFTPVKGMVIAPYESSRLGVTLETKVDATVAALDTGLVIYKGNKDETGFTVVIRHANGLESVYGWIEAKVELNDWIKGGETIGKVSANTSKQAGYLYFAISKDNRYLNPMDVVAFD